MKKHTVVTALFLAGLFAAMAAPRVLGAEDVKKEIDAANAEFARLFAAGDAAALAGRYTEQGQILPPGAEAVTGRPAIEAYWKAAFQAGLSKLTLTALEVEGFGDTAIETGRAEITDAKGRQSMWPSTSSSGNGLTTSGRCTRTSSIQTCRRIDLPFSCACKSCTLNVC